MNIERKTDLWVWELIKEANLNGALEPEKSSIFEIQNALSSSSKRQTGHSGKPEYIGVVNDFIVVIENKASTDRHEFRNENDILDMSVLGTENFAVNGAVWYAQNLAKKTNFKKIFGVGVSGNEKHHKITPYFIDERGRYTKLDDVETFIQFSHENIQTYYLREVLKVETDKEKELSMILKDAAQLHEYLRTYGSIGDQDKPIIVSGILLALNEIEYKNFSIESLTGDKVKTDGMKIYEAIESSLKRSRVAPATKLDKILNQFTIITDNRQINVKHNSLGMTPLKYYTEYLYNNIYTNIRYAKSSEDILGRFYGEFMSYSGGDGQSLGIVLTPRHITDLFCELLDLKYDDIILDPTCGTGGFLVSAMHYMLENAKEEIEEKELEVVSRNIRQNQLHGIESQSRMFTIATTNMILRGDGKSNLLNEDFLIQNPFELQKEQFTVGMINPPYSQGTKDAPEQYEISFTEHLLDSMVKNGRVAIIVPQSSMTGKTKHEKEFKENILKKHTLEGVITLNKNTFYGVGVNPCIAVFTAGIPHSRNHRAKFINFEDDGFVVHKHIGLVETVSAVDKKENLLNVWYNRVEATTDFCVETTVRHDDEWLHSFYYFNDTIPAEEDFEKTISDYLTFELDMVLHNREYLFTGEHPKVINEKEEIIEEIRNEMEINKGGNIHD
ncbi:N-6 DNA methylase [Macrococcus sp. S115]|uniref:HsdM family class I SAM-dependent methyltransferase n=1 Tax=Macrococcus sp. S115 TaxID=3047480 RepID=UPI0024BC5FAB|nr:N-6 DNA methylase [Macrococcus sp. S115]MDJ1112632.1 N-6 DNA methylase [Macrococcus sp. S115]